MNSLKKRSLAGVAWTFVQQFSVQGITFFVSIILARLLMPEEFGLIGMIAVVIAIGQSLRDSGMTQSLIRTVNPTEADYSTVFFMNLLLSVLIYMVIYFTAPSVASFFDREVLIDIIRVLALKIPIGALSSIQNTRLTKEMKFRQQMIIQVPSVIGAGILGVSLAYFGWGVWGLVFMNLAQIVLVGIQLWFYSSWRPQLIFDKSKLKEHFSFGYKLTLSGLLDVLYQNMYHVIIGKYFSAAQLGFYTRAQSTKQLPVSNISTALNKVTFPMFAEIQGDDVRMKNVYKRVMQQVLFWIAPVLTGAGVLAEPMFRFLFTEKWLPAVPFFQMLCIVGIMYPLHSYNLNILKVKGRSDLFLKVEIIKKVYTVICVLLIIPFGIYALIGFQIISTFVGFFINTYYSGQLINYRLKEQLSHISPIFLLSAFMGIACYLLDQVFIGMNQIDFLRLIFVSLLGGLFYLSLAHFFKMEPYLEFRAIIQRKK